MTTDFATRYQHPSCSVVSPMFPCSNLVYFPRCLLTKKTKPFHVDVPDPYGTFKS